MARLNEQLAGLVTLSPARLRAEWQLLHKSPAPRISVDLLARGIAWRLQERAYGGLTPAAARELRQLTSVNTGIAGDRGGAKPATVSAGDLRPGTTLMRTWSERNWTVLVTEKGLVFEGRRYASLSQIASEITGAHWSGPRFFGLKATAAPGAKPAKSGADA